jgi:Spy/CpxP family protein refolding chaperone
MKRQIISLALMITPLAPAMAQTVQSAPGEVQIRLRQRYEDDLNREYERAINRWAEQVPAVPGQRNGGAGGRGGGLGVAGGAWWTNPNLVARLGLTDDQKTRIEKAFENHRQDLVTKSGVVEKEEQQLARLLESDPLDRNAVFSQIDRVIQARNDLERTNSAMTLEMREVLTRAQWLQLPQMSTGRFYWNTTQPPAVISPTVPEGQRGRGVRGGGQRQQ